MRADRAKITAAGLSAALTWLAALAGCEQGNQYAPPPPPEVTVSPPLRRAVTSYVEYTGSSRPFETVDLRARVKGFLKKVDFQEGAEVKADQVIMVIDEEPFKVRVATAKAKLDEANAALEKAKQSKAREVAEAQLALDQAMLTLSQVEERRNRTLLSRNAASREDVDKSEASTKKSAAQVEADKANLDQTKADFQTNILAAQAQVEAAQSDLKAAEIDLGYCRIASPIDGRITRKLVDVGNLVGDTDSTVLATVVKDDPIYAYFSASEADLLMFRSLVSKGERADYRKEPVPIDLGLANETGFPHKGKLDYADPAVDPATGTVQARGLFPNPDHEIIAGLFVRIRVPLRNDPNALLVPERALGTDQQGRFALVVGAGNKVERRQVVTGPSEGDLRVILEGLGPDDKVVVDGVQFARPGLVVNPQPAAIKPATPAGPDTSKAQQGSAETTPPAPAAGK